MGHHKIKSFKAINIAVLTISDTRTFDNDTSGQYLEDSLKEAGHKVCDRKLIPDHRYQIRSEVSQWIADDAVQAVLITGGTGLTGRDGTPEAITPLLDKTIDGFGELFRHLSYEDIGTSTLQSRALSGIANGTIIFCMPGSTGACKTAWQGIIKDQLDSRTTPCNLIALLPRFTEV
jgi:molybdenum cofactor biosynthesis protein B